MAPTAPPRIGQMVRYCPGGSGDSAYWIAAVVTMTPEEWVPGARDADGEWVPTTGVKQPAAHTVHLRTFPPPGSGATETDHENVAVGDSAGCYQPLA